MAMDHQASADAYGMISCWPIWRIELTAIPFASAIACADVPNLFAIALSVSPACTTYTCCVGRGVAVGARVGVGDAVGVGAGVAVGVGRDVAVAAAVGVADAVGVAMGCGVLASAATRPNPFVE